ncbi:helix-turn-helix transcriptional regulator [Amycolatopsis jejuensis]|uniref:helix-turn-helix transcriptional regulator n=1 Tax=Amycolatopsis jejuensis TaxID=330084 RepID=UPI000523FD29|nr:AraC family transcriptional regulator [Amycolatopsis jejuensis]
MTQWDTAAVPGREQFGYWHEVICQAFVPLTPVLGEVRPDFPATVETRPMVAMNRALISSQAQLTRHGPKEVAATADPFYFVNLQVDGRCRVQHSGKDSLVEPGQFVVLDTTRPYYLDFDRSWRMLSFRVPHRDLDRKLAGYRPELGVPIRGTGVGSAAVALMTALWNTSAPIGAARELEQAFGSAVAAALTAMPLAEEIAGPVSRTIVLAYVREHLADELSVDSVCAEFAISPRSLHKIFAGSDETFAATVRRLRLEEAAELLADPRRPVANVGEAVGMPDPSSFARAFRRHHGVSPHEYRRREMHSS